MVSTLREEFCKTHYEDISKRLGGSHFVSYNRCSAENKLDDVKMESDENVGNTCERMSIGAIKIEQATSSIKEEKVE